MNVRTSIMLLVITMLTSGLSLIHPLLRSKIGRKSVRYLSTQDFTNVVEKVNPYKDYALVSYDKFHKIERFGNITVLRPLIINLNSQFQEPPLSSLKEKSHLYFHNKKWKTEILPLNGTWVISMIDRQKFNLGTLAGGQVGIFPEQEANWNFISEKLIKRIDKDSKSDTIDEEPLKILNCFAYTGGSTTACLIDDRVEVRTAFLMLRNYLISVLVGDTSRLKQIRNNYCSSECRFIVYER